MLISSVGEMFGGLPTRCSKESQMESMCSAIPESIKCTDERNAGCVVM